MSDQSFEWRELQKCKQYLAAEQKTNSILMREREKWMSQMKQLVSDVAAKDALIRELQARLEQCIGFEEQPPPR